MKKFPWWPYIRIELEILGVVTDTRFVQNKDYQRILNLFIAYGKTQPLEWAVFVKRHIGKKTQYQRERRRKVENEKRRAERELAKQNKTL